MITRCSSILVFVLCCVSFSSQAFVFTVSEKQLNQVLAIGFPISRSYQNVDVTFSDPKVNLDALDKKVLISTVIVAKQNGQTLHATGTIEGKLDYHAMSQQLRFEKPTLKEFKVISNDIAAADEAIRTVRQTIGRNLPIIILVDFGDLDIGLGDIAPREIDITPRGLSITL